MDVRVVNCLLAVIEKPLDIVFLLFFFSIIQPPPRSTLFPYTTLFRFLGLNTTTNGVDPNNVFNYFLIAYGGQDIVTKDGKLHLDDPKVREAAIKALTYPAMAYKEGFRSEEHTSELQSPM